MFKWEFKVVWVHERTRQRFTDIETAMDATQEGARTEVVRRYTLDGYNTIQSIELLSHWPVRSSVAA